MKQPWVQCALPLSSTYTVRNFLRLSHPALLPRSRANFSSSLHTSLPLPTTTPSLIKDANIMILNSYALGMPHDAWLLFLPYIIETYKTGYSSIGQEGVQAWYRPNPNSAGCGTNGTTGNTASQSV